MDVDDMANTLKHAI